MLQALPAVIALLALQTPTAEPAAPTATATSASATATHVEPSSPLFAAPGDLATSLPAPVEAAPALPAPAAAPAPVVTPAPSPAPVCKIAVLDLKAGDGFTEKGAEALTDALATEIEARSSCEVMSRADIRSMISFEAEKQLLGCGEESCLAELGGALGVEVLVTGSVSKVGEATLLSLKKINLRDLKVARRVTDTFAGADDEVVVFTQWMARRLEQGDAKAGGKPVPRPKVVAAAGDPDRVKFVEKHMTLWRGLAWTGVGVTALSAVLTAGAIGGTYGLSWYVAQQKTRPESQEGGTDENVVKQSLAVGPHLATASNLGIYLTGALLAGTVALFFLPAEEFEVRELDAAGAEVKP